MTNQGAGKIAGGVLIAGVWIVCGVIVLALGALLFLHVEGQYLLSEEQTGVASVIRPAATATRVPSGDEIARAYVLRFSSGEEREVTFPAGAELNAGDQIRLTFRRTRVRGEVVVNTYERIARQ